MFQQSLKIKKIFVTKPHSLQEVIPSVLMIFSVIRLQEEQNIFLFPRDFLLTNIGNSEQKSSKNTSRRRIEFCYFKEEEELSEITKPNIISLIIGFQIYKREQYNN